MLQRVIETAQAALPPDEHGSRITVVLGAHAEAVRAGVIERLAPPHPEVVVCADWDSGMAHSLRCGLTELARRGGGTFSSETQSATSAALVMLGDTPFLTASDLQRMIDAWRISPDMPAAAAYDVDGLWPTLGDGGRKIYWSIVGSEGFQAGRAAIRTRL